MKLDYSKVINDLEKQLIEYETKAGEFRDALVALKKIAIKMDSQDLPEEMSEEKYNSLSLKAKVLYHINDLKIASVDDICFQLLERNIENTSPKLPKTVRDYGRILAKEELIIKTVVNGNLVYKAK